MSAPITKNTSAFFLFSAEFKAIERSDPNGVALRGIEEAKGGIV
jgi:hypothetical protein